MATFSTGESISRVIDEFRFRIPSGAGNTNFAFTTYEVPPGIYADVKLLSVGYVSGYFQGGTNSTFFLYDPNAAASVNPTVDFFVSEQVLDSNDTFVPFVTLNSFFRLTEGMRIYVTTGRTNNSNGNPDRIMRVRTQIIEYIAPGGLQDLGQFN